MPKCCDLEKRYNREDNSFHFVLQIIISEEHRPKTMVMQFAQFCEKCCL